MLKSIISGYTIKKKIFSVLLFAFLLSGCVDSSGRATRDSGVTTFAGEEIAFLPEAQQYQQEICDLPHIGALGSGLIAADGGLYFFEHSTHGSTIYFLSDDERLSTVAFFPDVTVLQVDKEDSVLYALTNDTVLSQNGEEIRSQRLLSVDSDGNAGKEYSLEALFPYGVSDFCCVQNTLFFWDSGVLYAVEPNDELELLYKIDTALDAKMAVLPSGRLVLGQYENDGYVIRTLDSGSRSLTNERHFNNHFTGLYSGGVQHSLYLNDGSALYAYDEDSNTYSRLFVWSRLGLISGRVCEVGGCLFALSSTDQWSSKSVYLLAPQEGGDHNSTESAALILATIDGETTEHHLGQLIRNWNFTHPDYPIEVRDYSVYNDGSDSRAAELRLIADIAAGRIPDMYDLSEVHALSNEDAEDRLSIGLLARRGLLEDLNPFLDGDPRLSRTDFYENILSAMEFDNKLYYLSPGFVMQTVVSSSSLVGERASWDYASFTQTIVENPQIERLFTCYYSQEDFLKLLLDNSESILVDWENGSCSFESDYFITLLNLAKTEPQPMPDYIFDVADAMREPNLLTLFSVPNYIETLRLLDVFGEAFVYTGYPELGSVAYLPECYGISAFSEYQKECWQFLSQVMQADYSVGSLPLRRDKSEALIQSIKMLEGIYNDYPGLDRLLDETEQEIERINIVRQHDGQVWHIVQREANAFFYDGKSAEDVAKIIQSRVMIYLVEQS